MSVKKQLATTEEKMTRILEVRGEQAHVTIEVGETPTPPLPWWLTMTMADQVEVKDEWNQQHAKTNKPLELLILHLDRPKTVTRIGIQDSLADREALKQLLKEHRDIFAWSHEEMLGIDRYIIKHNQDVDPAHKLVH